MTKVRELISQAPDRPSIPPTVIALSGATIDSNATRWVFHDGLYTCSINFGRLSECATTELVQAMKVPLIWYIENTEGGSAATVFEHLRTLLLMLATTQRRPVAVIDAPDLINLRASLTPDTEWKLGAIAAFLKKWHDLGAPGVTDDAIRFLKSIRLKGNRKGTAVLTMDPIEGPLTDVERSAVQAALNDAFAAGNVALDDYLLAWLSLLLGQRNIQLAMLKVCDISEVVKNNEDHDYVLRIPRVKQESAQARREQFKERLITPSIGRMLLSYANSVRKRFEGEAKLPDASQAPLFPQRGRTRCERADFHYHTTPDEIGNRISAIFAGLQVYSERTGKPVKVTSKRLRHTVATFAAREGHGELIIAELLDHSDTQNVGVYVKATPEIVERIDRAIALRMAPLAHAFAGSIIQDESAAIRGDDPTSRIVDPRFDEKLKPMGSCGRKGSCDFMAPIACYTCGSFQAWADGPHEAVLTYLIAERERLMSDADERIATINDRTILAVAEVVRQVRQIRGEAVDGC